MQGDQNCIIPRSSFLRSSSPADAPLYGADSEMVTLSATTLAEIVIGASVLTALAIFSLRPSAGPTTGTGTGTTAVGGSAKKKKKKAATTGVAIQGKENGVSSSLGEVRKEISEKVLKVEEVPLIVSNKKKAKRIPLSSLPSPITPTPPPSLPSIPTVPSIPANAPTFAKIVAPNSIPISPPAVKPATKKSKATKANPLSDMRDLDVDPEESKARVMKIVDSRPPVEGTPEWREWAAKNDSAQGGEDQYEDSGEVREVEGSWEVAKKRSSPLPLPLPILTLYHLTGPSTRPVTLSISSSAFAASNPAPRSIPGLSSSAQGALTKKQRENSKQAGKKALEKEEAERERNERLLAHRKELDRTRYVLPFPPIPFLLCLPSVYERC